ncbi:siderophore-iron reductase FhuF [Erwinia sp. MYb375]|uniref:siderophore-iron reductase FhuF n=1 Tax=Erwinia sp. MYb375 TaxID=2745272 RepID=UPI0030A3CD74
MMLKLFAPLTPAFLPLVRGVTLPDASISDNRLLPATHLLQHEFIAQQLKGFAHQHGWERQDVTAVASMWSKHYLSLFSGGWLFARILYDTLLPADLKDLLLLLDADGQVTAVVVPDEGKSVAPVSTVEDFSIFFQQHIDAHFVALSAVTGVKAPVLWSNIANGVEGLRHLLSASGYLSPEKEQAIAALFTEKFWPDGARNLMYRSVFVRRSPDGEAVKLRKGCCLRYLLPEMGYCKNCCLPQAWQANYLPSTTDN